MKKVKIALTTFMTFSDETEIYEVELEDVMAEQLDALSEGENLTEDEIQENLHEDIPDVASWVVPHSVGPRFPGPLLIRTRCPDTSPNSRL